MLSTTFRRQNRNSIIFFFLGLREFLIVPVVVLTDYQYLPLSCSSNIAKPCDCQEDAALVSRFRAISKSNSLFTDFSGQVSGIRLACQMTFSEQFDWNNFTKALNPDSVSRRLRHSVPQISWALVLCKTSNSRTNRLGNGTGSQTRISMRMSEETIT
jgi:hypothetical protein